MVDGVMRGHSLILFKRKVRLDVGKYRYGNRVCDEWNGVAEDVVMAGSLIAFKDKLDLTSLEECQGVCLSCDFSSVYCHQPSGDTS